ncbi:sn-glycerol-3-phosphate ABC transporter substrate-binding protein UgpB [Limobrevibacterium gyesilva]|uniref:sn-glycerol-3-phosphate-binding periplasmic protein UgpB n=1 Tax=Limobrevibacterium gyesilva TaxID=2991712 RepID=A0AA42CJ21_9PROT|nr:sn-glycerol-3-phosphate ABC transporter substrate-binding protein UgpB [Limobrevibacterium gyesilva]MCW3476507.1 sn-glycerol-3-phosphate ABC transporter substrate-binding protein UgpB [Limobrevibacterium gyesilva]
MKRRTLLAGAAALAATPTAFAPTALAQAGGKTKIVFWHAMTGANNDEINRIARDFNASQSAVELEAIYKGTYPETLTLAIAAWRAGQAPHIVQVFEVGTGSMLAAGPAVKQVWQLVQDTGLKIDPAAYIPAVRGYYSLPDGRMASMPLNSSTAVMWYNKDAFEMAGLDPESPPDTWPKLVVAARALKEKWAIPTMAKDKGLERVATTTSWLTWIQLEQFCAIHNLPYATKANGFEGLDAELKLNNPAAVKHLQRLLDMAKEGTFKYAGRDTAPDPLFYSGQAAIGFGSSAGRGDIVRNAKFKWAPALLPYDPEVTPSPNNTIIGGASLWTMTTPNRTPAEYKAVAQLLQFIGQPAQDAMYHQHTGYVPVTLAGFELSKTQGYYEKNPGADLAITSLTRGTVTENSRGLRLGRLPEIRNIIYEEVEKALQGQQGAQQALDSAVQRGNRVLREFEKSVRT